MTNAVLVASTVGVLLLTVALYVYLSFVHEPYLLYKRLKSQGLAASRYIPFVGHLPTIIAKQNEGKAMQLLIDEMKRYGTVYAHTVMHFVQLRVMEPRYLQEVLRAKNDCYQKSELARLFLASIVGMRNLLFEEGEVHALHRRMLAPSFRHESLLGMQELMAQRARDHVEKWLKEADEFERAQSTGVSSSSCSSSSSSKQPSFEIELHRRLSALTLDIITSSAFGDGFRHMPDASKIVFDAFETTVMHQQYRFQRLIPFIPIVNKLPFFYRREMEQSNNRVKSLVDRVIADRKQGLNKCNLMKGQSDLLDLLLHAKDESGVTLTDDEVREQALVFVSAGHETTSSLLTFALIEMTVRQPHLLSELAEEVDRVCGKNATPTASQLGSLQLLDAVLHETLRYWPPVPLFSREAVVEHVLTAKGLPDIMVPKGTLLTIPTAAVHRNPEYWGKDADVFDHTRWLRSPRPPHPFAFIPFSGGTRNCIGSTFALLEAKTILAVIVQQVRFKWAPNQVMVDGFPFVQMAVTLRPKFGAKVFITRA